MRLDDTSQRIQLVAICFTGPEAGVALQTPLDGFRISSGPCHFFNGQH